MATEDNRNSKRSKMFRVVTRVEIVPQPAADGSVQLAALAPIEPAPAGGLVYLHAKSDPNLVEYPSSGPSSQALGLIDGGGKKSASIMQPGAYNVENELEGNAQKQPIQSRQQLAELEYFKQFLENRDVREQLHSIIDARIAADKALSSSENLKDVAGPRKLNSEQDSIKPSAS